MQRQEAASRSASGRYEICAISISRVIARDKEWLTEVYGNLQTLTQHPSREQLQMLMEQAKWIMGRDCGNLIW